MSVHWNWNILFFLCLLNFCIRTAHHSGIFSTSTFASTAARSPTDCCPSSERTFFDKPIIVDQVTSSPSGTSQQTCIPRVQHLFPSSRRHEVELYVRSHRTSNQRFVLWNVWWLLGANLHAAIQTGNEAQTWSTSHYPTSTFCPQATWQESSRESEASRFLI